MHQLLPVVLKKRKSEYDIKERQENSHCDKLQDEGTVAVMCTHGNGYNVAQHCALTLTSNTLD
jgi:hypothetical protein